METTTRKVLNDALAARGDLDCHNAIIELCEALSVDPDPLCADAEEAANAQDRPANAIRAAAAILLTPQATTRKSGVFVRGLGRTRPSPEGERRL